MAKLIVVCGATGQLGGSVARRMLKEGWKVRAVTRNVESEAAKALASQGAELVTADYDDESSLVKAFDGANAIFAVTQFWEYLMALGQEGAGEKESGQMLAIASAAGRTSTLEHFILHTLASGEKLAGKKFICPHWDYKDRAADKIKELMPEVAKKTTFLWVGYFTSNIWRLMTPFEVPGSYGAHIWLAPCKPDTTMWITDVENNVGVFVKYALANPSVSLPAKYVSVHTDIVPFNQALATWSEITGKRAEFVSITREQGEKIYGIFGKELASQFQLNEVAPDWGAAHKGQVVTAKELGIPDSELLTMRQSLETNKQKL